MAAGCRDSVKFVLYTDITTKDSRLAEELGHTNELTWWIPPTADGRDLEARTETDAIRLSVRVSLRIHISSSSMPLHHRRRRLDSSSVLSSSSRINIRQPVGRSVGRPVHPGLSFSSDPPSLRRSSRDCVFNRSLSLADTPPRCVSAYRRLSQKRGHKTQLSVALWPPWADLHSPVICRRSADAVAAASSSLPRSTAKVRY